MSRENLKGLENRYFNREISWLFFNARVIEEVRNISYPLLERVRFLSISGKNLDEFYMVRIAGLRTQAIAGHSTTSLDGQNAWQQLKRIHKHTTKLIQRQQKNWKQLREKLADEGIVVKTGNNLTQKERLVLSQIYQNEILPLLTPLTIDPAHPFPFIPNLGFGLALTLSGSEPRENRNALIIVPAHVPRFIKIGDKKSGRQKAYILLEDALEMFAPDLFPEFNICECGQFRITRNSDVAVDEEAEDLIRHFEFLLKKRRRGRVILLTVNAGMPDALKAFLIESFEAWDEEIVQVDGILGLGDLEQLIPDQRPELTFEPYEARFPERIREHDGNCFAAIAQKDILVHHPYEEFGVVVQFLQQAAIDPNVVTIKQTLYRTSDDSPIVRALIDAAERGKNVTALVELKARFDEETNLRWARDLERAGAHVVYGFVDYKTHAKVSLVIRQEGGNLRTYAHLGTGNYHAKNAKIYTDLALFTAKEEVGRDIGQLFNYLTSYTRPSNLKRLVIAPLNLRETLLHHIREEISYAQNGRPAAIWAKMNALVDKEVIDTLYEASQAGVQIDLVIRGICCLRPGVSGLSENIRVKSIVGRFLEHSRIVCFGNGDDLPNADAHIYFSSADWMPRNFDSRVETLVPADHATIRRQIMNQIMTANLLDTENSWVLGPDGKYTRIKTDQNHETFSAHRYFMENPSLSGRGQALQYNRPSELKQVRKQKRLPKAANATL